MTASSDIELEDDFRSETWRCRVALTDANADGAAAPHFLLVVGFLPLWGVEHEAVCGLTFATLQPLNPGQLKKQRHLLGY